MYGTKTVFLVFLHSFFESGRVGGGFCGVEIFVEVIFVVILSEGFDTAVNRVLRIDENWRQERCDCNDGCIDDDD